MLAAKLPFLSTGRLKMLAMKLPLMSAGRMRKSSGVKAAAEEDARGEAAADEGRKAEEDGNDA